MSASLQLLLASKIAAGGGSFLLQEDMTGGSGTTPPSGWSITAGTWNWSNTSPALPQGGNNANVTSGTPEYGQKAFTAQSSECWAYFQYRISSLAIGAAQVIFALQDSGNVNRCYVKLNTDGTLQIWNSQFEASATTAALSVNTNYHIWVHYKAGGGTGTIDVGFSTAGTRQTAGTAFASVPNTTETATVSKVALWTTDSLVQAYFDHVLVNNSQIGDNP